MILNTHRAWILLLLTVLVSCQNAHDNDNQNTSGDADTDSDTDSDTDTDADTDSDTDSDQPDDVKQPTSEGRILVATSAWGGETYVDAYITIDFFDGPMRMDAFSAYTPGLHKEAMRGGDCVLYTASDAACNPVCNWDQFCSADNKCTPAPLRLQAGKVTIGAGSTIVPAEPGLDDFSPGFYFADPIPAALVSADTFFTVAAAGGTFPAFELEAPGLNKVKFNINLTTNELVLRDGEDNDITWETEDAQGIVQLVVNHGWHGAPPEAVLYCEAPAATGRLAIPQAVVEALPVIGGMGLMQHGSFIAVTNEVKTTVNGMTVAFAISHRDGLNVNHNADGF